MRSWDVFSRAFGLVCPVQLRDLLFRQRGNVILVLLDMLRSIWLFLSSGIVVISRLILPS